MEDKKDIQRDTRGDVRRPLEGYYGIYEDYGSVVLVHRKTERVVAALFLVTEYLTDDNPIRHKVRHLGVDLMSFILSTQGNKKAQSEGSHFVRTYSSRLLEIVSLLEVAFLSEQISEMNFRLLGSEIERLASIVDRLKKEDDPLSSISKVSNVFLADRLNQNGANGVTVSSKLRRRVFGKGHSQKSKFTGKINTPVSVGSEKMSHRGITNQDSKKVRKDTIIKALSVGVKMSVRDFSSVLNDVSEKTIQRELVSLIASGVLKREGDRRWSRYYLSDVNQVQ